MKIILAIVAAVVASETGLSTESADCVQYKTWCNIGNDWMEKNCPKTCEGVQTTDSCDRWKSHCGKSAWMDKHCQKTCTAGTLRMGENFCVSCNGIPKYDVPSQAHIDSMVQPNEEGYATVKVADGIHAIMSGGYNSLLVQGTEGHALLVDIGHDNAKPILAGVKAILGEKPLTHFLYGHNHHDHVGGASHVREAYPGAVFLASKETAEILADMNGPSRPHDTSRGDVVLDISKPLEAGGVKYEFIAVRSHSDDNMLLKVNGDILFAADIINAGSTPFFNFVFGRNNLRHYRRDLVLIQDTPWEKFVTGHGNRLIERPEVQVTIDYVDAVIAAALGAFSKVDFNGAVADYMAAGNNPQLVATGLYRTYYERLADACVKDVLTQWRSGEKNWSVIVDIDATIATHCWSAMWFHHMLAPGR